ncbi:MAG: hypothetical protein KC964_31760 [Candidatus Omnitrophica bacterium]|nr:hypothetical protein [Candidatus Omnitrophota bacterium]
MTQGKSADFILEFDESVLFFECKATEYTFDTRTRNALASSNFVRKIGRGVAQIGETIDSLTDTGFVGDRRCLGFVVTLGDTFHPNAPEFQRMITNQIADENNAERLRSGQIQIMPIRILEQFVAAILHLQKSPIEIFEEKKAHPDRGYGDWSWFLRKELELDMNVLLQLLTPPMEAADEFYEEIEAAMST